MSEQQETKQTEAKTQQYFPIPKRRENTTAEHQKKTPKYSKKHT